MKPIPTKKYIWKSVNWCSNFNELAHGGLWSSLIDMMSLRCVVNKALGDLSTNKWTHILLKMTNLKDVLLRANPAVKPWHVSRLDLHKYLGTAVLTDKPWHAWSRQPCEDLRSHRTIVKFCQIRQDLTWTLCIWNFFLVLMECVIEHAWSILRGLAETPQRGGSSSSTLQPPRDLFFGTIGIELPNIVFVLDILVISSTLDTRGQFCRRTISQGRNLGNPLLAAVKMCHTQRAYTVFATQTWWVRWPSSVCLVMCLSIKEMQMIFLPWQVTATTEILDNNSRQAFTCRQDLTAGIALTNHTQRWV